MKYAACLFILILLAAVIISAGCLSKSATEVPDITGRWTIASQTVHENGQDGFIQPALTNAVFDVAFQEGRLFSGTYAGTAFYGSFFSKDGTQFILTSQAPQGEGNLSAVQIGTVVNENEIMLAGAVFSDTGRSLSEEQSVGTQSSILLRNSAEATAKIYPAISGVFTFDGGSLLSRDMLQAVSGGNLVVLGQKGGVFYGIADTGSETEKAGGTDFSAVLYGGDKPEKILFVTGDGKLWFGSASHEIITVSSLDERMDKDHTAVKTLTYVLNGSTAGTQQAGLNFAGIWSTRDQEVISKDGYDAGLPSDFIIGIGSQNTLGFIAKTSYMGVDEGETGGIVSSGGDATLFRYDKNGGIYLGMGWAEGNTLSLSEIFTDADTEYVSTIRSVRI
ncbi:MAG: hypothetical protein VB020_06440 [Methanocorpusculum sp.]|nr:hypothetical protein [Methanocorpusculum sp.]